MNDRSGTITSKNQAVVIALAVLLAVSLSAVAALVVNRANSQQIGADTPTTIQVDVTSPQNSDEEPTAGEEIDLTSTENQTVEEAPVEEAPVVEAPTEEDPSTDGPDLDLDFDIDIVLPCPDGFVRLESGICVPDIDIDFDFDFDLPCPDGFVRLESGACVPDFDFDIDILPCPEGLIWVNGHCVPDFGLDLIQPDFDFGLIQPDFDFDFDLTDRFPGL